MALEQGRGSARGVTLCAAAGALALALLGIFGRVAAHGDLHEQIAGIDRQLTAEPRRADLFLRRAELHRLHREYEAAAADYGRVLELEPAHPEVHWLRARARLDEGNAALALPELDAFLSARAGHASARLTRARVYTALMRFGEAAGEFSAALRLLPQPEPDHYLERMRAQQAAGVGAAARLAGLTQGLTRLGSVPGLEEAALEIELESGNWDAALARLERRAAGMPRQEQWLFRRGQVLAKAGRTAEAIAALRTCLQAIDALPATLGGTKAIGQLAGAARAELDRLQR